MRPLAPDYIQSLDPYVPGKTVPHLIKLASNENPFGASPKGLKMAQQALSDVQLYPGHCVALKEKICEFHAQFDLKPNQIVCGNGSTELISLLVRTFVAKDECVLTAWPSFLMYRIATQVYGHREISVPLTQTLEYDLENMLQALSSPEGDLIKLVFIANPNNPTGRYIKTAALRHFFERIPAQTVVILDEAYIEYVTALDYPNGLEWVRNRARTVVLRTFSKVYGLAGLRIAYAICDPEIAALLHRAQDPFSVNHVAQAAAMGALEDFDHVQKSVASNTGELTRMEQELRKLGVKTTESAANFLLAHFKNAPFIYEGLINHGVIVRPLANYNLPNALRITIGTPPENRALLTALGGLVSD